jgi:hypothetical protein
MTSGTLELVPTRPVAVYDVEAVGSVDMVIPQRLPTKLPKIIGSA